MTELFLQIVNGPKKGKKFPMEGRGVMIGADDTCDVVLKDPMISPQHAEIEITEDRLLLRKISEKGLVKVDGQNISEIEISFKQNFQIGVLSFRVIRKKAKEVLPNLTSFPEDIEEEHGIEIQENEILQNTDGEGELIESIQEEGEVNEFLVKKPSPLTSALKWIVIIALFGIAAFVFKSIEDPELEAIVLPYKVGEEKLIDLRGYLIRKRVSARPVKAVVSQPTKMKARVEKSVLKILWFKTLDQGEVVVDLYDYYDKPLLKLKFVIKGYKESRADKLVKLFASKDERLVQAKQLIKKASIIEEESPHEAVGYYSKALDLISSVSTSSELYFECRRLMKKPKEVLDIRLGELWEMCRNYRKNKEYEEAFPFVEKILTLVPDPNNIDHQRALIHKKYILKKID